MKEYVRVVWAARIGQVSHVSQFPVWEQEGVTWFHDLRHILSFCYLDSESGRRVDSARYGTLGNVL